jgi:ABC-type branched-subunit amino acid transport system ATPase component
VENSEGLAPVTVLELKHIIAQLKERGLSVLLVEQNVAMALGVLRKRSGKVWQV